MSLENNRSSMGIPLKRRKLRPMSQINVTPMVDIMLVLLIVFMVSAPLLTTGVPRKPSKGNHLYFV